MGLGRCPPKCDTNPLTLPERPCYYPHRSNTNLTISRRNQKPREAHPRTQRLSPSQRPYQGPAAQAKVAISSYQRPRLSLPLFPGDGRSTDYTRQAPSYDAPADSTLHITGCVYPGPLRAGFPGRSTDPRFSKALVPCLSRRPSHPSTRRMHRDAGYESPPQAACSPSAVRSSAAHGGIGPTQP